MRKASRFLVATLVAMLGVALAPNVSASITADDGTVKLAPNAQAPRAIGE